MPSLSYPPSAPLHRTFVFMAFSVLAAVVGATAAFAALSLGFAPWAMFVGWVAYFTRPISARQGVLTFACVAGGLTFGLVAVVALAALGPRIGVLALPVVVFQRVSWSGRPGCVAADPIQQSARSGSRSRPNFRP